MTLRKLIAGAAVLGVGVAGTSAAVAATSARTPKNATINAVQTLRVKINRYVQDGLRWQKDTYVVRSGGTLHVVNLAPSEGPHTFTVVKKKDLPRTPKQVNNCKICQTLGQAHGADPNSQAPPQFLFLENGQGQSAPPNVDAPGDSGFVGGNKRDHTDLKITAKKGSTLRFMCLIHPWMQAKIVVR